MYYRLNSLPTSILFLPTVCIAQTPIPTPVISIDKVHHDFGTITQNQKVTHIYQITNTGNEVLEIKAVIPSCGCTTTTLDNDKLQPGESTIIEINFDPEGLRGNTHKSLAIISNDPKNPSTYLTFEANILEDFTRSTTTVLFQNLQRNETRSAKVMLKSNINQPIIITRIMFPDQETPYITCNYKPVENDIVLEIKIDTAQIPDTKYQGLDLLNIHTTSKNIPFTSILIQWNIATNIPLVQGIDPETNKPRNYKK